MRASALLLLGLMALPSTARASEQSEFSLRVMSYNVWGVPMIAPLRAERMARIGPAVAELAPDVIALQEVWTDEDAAILFAGLESAGYPHMARIARDWPDDSGLMIVSRFPLRDARFVEFNQGRYPHVPWHVDYMAGKGVLRVVVETPAGPIDFVCTHLQAGYNTDDYIFVQMSQALDAAELVADSRLPLVFAGDINSPFDGMPSRVLRARADLDGTDPKAHIDQILYRSGERARLSHRPARKVLTETVDLESARMPLSDHPGILAEVVIRPCDGQCRRPTIAARLGALRGELGPMVAQEVALRRFMMTRDLILALALPLVAFLMFGFGRRLRGRRALLLRTAAFMLLMGGGWFTYLHASFGPAHLADLIQIQGRIISVESPRS